LTGCAKTKRLSKNNGLRRGRMSPEKKSEGVTLDQKGADRFERREPQGKERKSRGQRKTLGESLHLLWKGGICGGGRRKIFGGRNPSRLAKRSLTPGVFSRMGGVQRGDAKTVVREEKTGYLERRESLDKNAKKARSNSGTRNGRGREKFP